MFTFCLVMIFIFINWKNTGIKQLKHFIIHKNKFGSPTGAFSPMQPTISS